MPSARAPHGRPIRHDRRISVAETLVERMERDSRVSTALTLGIGRTRARNLTGAARPALKRAFGPRQSAARVASVPLSEASEISR
jgi:hypothetical protein